MILREMTIPAFVEELASSSPAPGGGSIAALGGALAAGLSSMVGELTLGRAKYAAVQGDMEALAARGKEIASKLLLLIDEDTDAFNAFMAAMKLPKDTDEQKAVRKEAMQKAAKGTAEVPLKTLGLCVQASKLALEAIEKGNANAVTDAATAGQFARAAALAASYNVRVNLLSIKDEAFVAEKRAVVAALMLEVESVTAAISVTIEKALS